MSDDNKAFEHEYSQKDVKIFSKKRVFSGFFAIDRYYLSYAKFGGGQSREFMREIFERDHDAVAILPYDPQTDEVSLIEQFRPGALKDKQSPWLFEIVAGMIDDGESPEQAALRELEEESGIKLDSKMLHKVTGLYPSPGGCSEYVTIFIAGVSLKKLESSGGLDEEGEDIRVFKVKASEAFAKVKDGTICNAASLIALQALELRHQELRESLLQKM